MDSRSASMWLLKKYPEQDPFLLIPPLRNLTPSPPDDSGDTAEFRAACCEVARRSVYKANPLSRTFGSCPFVVLDRSIFDEDMPLSSYVQAPDLQKAELTEELVFLEQINPRGNTPLFTVRVGQQVLLLKMFRDKEPQLEGSGVYKPQDLPPHPLKRFARECEAYAQLKHHGACAAGVVPQCYGWLELTAADTAAIEARPDVHWTARWFANDDGPPKALLLEYFTGAQQLSTATITPAAADAALRALCRVHAACVAHGDVHGRNILALPDGRVVWIDFDAARTPLRATRNCPVQRHTLYDELEQAWTYFYEELLPNKRIGLN